MLGYGYHAISMKGEEMAYKHLSIEERAVLAIYVRHGCSVREAAAAIGRSPSTVSRELRRTSKWDGARGFGYYAFNGVKESKARASLSRSGPRYPSESIVAVAEKLMLTWSPEEIAGRLRGQGVPSWRTIYRWVESGVIQGGAKKLLRRKGKGGWCEARGKIGWRGKSIRKRDRDVYKRTEFGHWEADTVVSGRGKSRCCFLTLAERKSRLYLVRKIPSREAKYATEAMVSMLSRFPRELVKTITCDNGKEFAGWRDVEKALGCDVYFTDAFCAWQKGTNENTNGLLRQFFPKGYNLSRYNQKYIDGKVDLLNNRPRKCIGWKTPNEMIIEALAKCCT